MEVIELIGTIQGFKVTDGLTTVIKYGTYSEAARNVLGLSSYVLFHKSM